MPEKFGTFPILASPEGRHGIIMKADYLLDLFKKSQEWVNHLGFNGRLHAHAIRQIIRWEKSTNFLKTWISKRSHKDNWLGHIKVLDRFFTKILSRNEMPGEKVRWIMKLYSCLPLEWVDGYLGELSRVIRIRAPSGGCYTWSYKKVSFYGLTFLSMHTYVCLTLN